MTTIHKAIVSYLNGAFWLRHQQETKRIPTEHCTDRDKLVAWTESQVGDTEIFYNFDSDLLPDEEPMPASVIPQPSRRLPPAKTHISRAPSIPMATSMARRRVLGTVVEGPQAPRVTLTCSRAACDKTFEKLQSTYQTKLAEGQINFYCSVTCASQITKLPPFILTCNNCQQSFERSRKEMNKKAKFIFCKKACANQYFRTHPCGIFGNAARNTNET